MPFSKGFHQKCQYVLASVSINGLDNQIQKCVLHLSGLPTDEKDHFESTITLRYDPQPGHARKLPVTWGHAVVFDGYSGFLHQLTLASHEKNYYN